MMVVGPPVVVSVSMKWVGHPEHECSFVSEQDGFAKLIAAFDATLPRGSVRSDNPANIKK